MAIYTDFSSLLAGATVVCGLIWGCDALLFKSKREKADPPRAEPKLVEYARSFFPILLVVCILRSFVAEPFRIPSGSMKPTLLEGDFILVNKFNYGIRLPLVGTKIIPVGLPQRGDVLVFRSPPDPSIDFIKRVIGVPGDKIKYQNKTLYLNGKPVKEEALGVDQEVDARNGHTYQVERFLELLPERSHDIYLSKISSGPSIDEIEVPPGKYFVMGDNRDNSEDSRVWGFVPESLILGKAFFIWMSWDPVAKDIRWKRLGKSIQLKEKK